ncbi:hypothetical protein H8356DRAFT_1339571 [Neocallimastix lanati (nom. inval.)]|nr:hypothetical protein H8356DRAFT_1339571 [Neocallimastix sp. JGI-2020a]
MLYINDSTHLIQSNVSKQFLPIKTDFTDRIEWIDLLKSLNNASSQSTLNLESIILMVSDASYLIFIIIIVLVSHGNKTSSLSLKCIRHLLDSLPYRGTTTLILSENECSLYKQLYSLATGIFIMKDENCFIKIQEIVGVYYETLCALVQSTNYQNKNWKDNTNIFGQKI